MMAKTSVFLAGGEAFSRGDRREPPQGLSKFDTVTWLRGFDGRAQFGDRAKFADMMARLAK